MNYDCIIIGGGIFGCSTGYELTKLGYKVLIIEKEYLGAGSTGRCIGGIRQQFSTPNSIKLAIESVKIFSQMEEEFGFSVEWYPGGYLFLAYTEEDKEKYLKLINLQREMGLDVNFIDKKEVLEIVPYIKCEIIGGAYCSTDGQANPFFVIKGYADGIKKRGGKILNYTKVECIKKDNNFCVLTDKGDKYYSKIVINAGGPWAREIASMLNIDLPLFPERHEAFITEPTKELFSPMLVSYTPSIYFQQLHWTKQIIGCYTPDNPTPGINHTSSIEFICEVSSRILKLIPVLSEVKVFRAWAGCYTMTPDGNPLIGEVEENFWLVAGGCGHGFMLGPAIGKGVAELIAKGKSSILLDEFLYPREFKKAEELK